MNFTLHKSKIYVPYFETRLLRGSVTFAAGTTGAIGQHTVFTITGEVLFYFFYSCKDPFASGGGSTISHGNVTTVAALVAVTTATTIDAGDYSNTADDTVIEATAFKYVGGATPTHLSTGTDITADILTATITGGTLEYYLFWEALSVGATVALGSELTPL